jgi:hypothetical protein
MIVLVDCGMSLQERGLEGQHVRQEQSHRGALGLGIDISAVDMTPSADSHLATVLTWSHEHMLCLSKCSCLILVIKLQKLATYVGVFWSFFHLFQTMFQVRKLP